MVEKGWPISDALERDERINALDASDKELVQKLLTETIRHYGELLNFVKSDDLILVLAATAIKILNLPLKEIIAGLKNEAQNYHIILSRLSQKEFTPDVKLNYPNWMIGSWRKAYGEARAQKIMEVMMHPPSREIPHGEFVESSETGNISARPEILLQYEITDITQFAINTLNSFLNPQNNQIKPPKSPPQPPKITLKSLSLQYEECEGLVKKLTSNSWQVIEQSRVFPCLDASGNAIAGTFTSTLEKR